MNFQYPPMTTGRAYEYDVYDRFRGDLMKLTELFSDILISHHAANKANINYHNTLYLIEMKFFNIGEKPWYEINAYKPTKISIDYDSLRRDYWSSVSDDIDNEYKMHPVVIDEKRFWSVDCAYQKTLNSFDEIKDDVQLWITEINKKILKARIEAI